MDSASLTFRRAPPAGRAVASSPVRPIGPNEAGWLLLTADERTLLRSGLAAILCGFATVAATGSFWLAELALVSVAVLSMILAPVTDDPAETISGAPALFVEAGTVAQKLRTLTTFVVLIIAGCIFHLVAALTA